MNGTAILADALDEAARRIETKEVTYNFDWMTQCNCGVLAQVIMGISESQLACLRYEGIGTNRGNDWDGIWTTAGEDITCGITGLPLGSILRTLGDAGLTFDDLANLEGLEDPAVQREAGWKRDRSCSTPRNAASYMRAWSRLIRRDLPKSMDADDVLATAHPVAAPALV